MISNFRLQIYIKKVPTKSGRDWLVMDLNGILIIFSIIVLFENNSNHLVNLKDSKQTKQKSL